MLEPKRKDRNNQRYTELYPWFAQKIKLVIQDLEAMGLRPRIQDAWRSKEDQLKAYKEHHTKVKFGFHNVTGEKGEKESLAVDLLDDDSPLKPSVSYILKVTAVAEKHGLTTGARWGLPSKLAKALDIAIQNQDWDAPVKVGWDPVHIQPENFTIKQALNGERPK